LVEPSRSIRPPKLLQPGPISDTLKPDLPRLRSFMMAPWISSRRHAGTDGARGKDGELAYGCASRLSRSRCRSGTEREPGRECAPAKQHRRSTGPRGEE